jgi:hypothetical protein
MRLNMVASLRERKNDLSATVPRPRTCAAAEAKQERFQAFRSVIRMIATTLLSLNACSWVPVLNI